MMIPKINKKLLPMKGHYFLFNAATGPVLPFLSVIARQLGFSGTVVGLIYTILPIIGMIIKPVLGGVADKYRCRKLLFILFQVVTAVGLFGINWIPPIPKTAKVHFACDLEERVFVVQNKNFEDTCAMENVMNTLGKEDIVKCIMDCDHLTQREYETMCQHWEYGLDICKNPHDEFKFTALVPKDSVEVIDKIITFKVVNISLNNGAITKPVCPDKEERISTICDISCNVPSLNELLSVPRSIEYEVLHEYQFWTFLALAILGWSGMAVVVSVGDAICFEMLGNQPNLYGYQRLWGSVGWGFISIFAGLMVDAFSDGEIKIYTSVFVLMLIIMTLDVLCSWRLQYKQEHMSMNIFRDVAKVLSQLRVLIYLLWCLFMGACTALVWSFLFWHLEDVAKAYDDASGDCNHQDWIKTLEGLVMGIQCLGGELPFFFLSKWFLERVGHIHCMTIVLLGIGVRYILYSVLVNPWWALPIELLNGITFGLFYATMASYASIVAPPGTEATVQGLVGAVFQGIGVSVGSLLGGVMFDAYGGWITFRSFGIASLISCLLFVSLQLFFGRRDKLRKDLDMRATHSAALNEDIHILDDHEFTLFDN